MKIGVIGTSEIAFRRFIPALNESDFFEYAGVASRDIKKTNKFVDKFGGKGYDGYDEILCDNDIEAIYIPLPPSLHYEWAKKALEAGKHVFLEKPSTTSLENTKQLTALAKSKGLAICENYMFVYHEQMEYVKKLLAAGEIGDLRLLRAVFCFPKRGINDFRYKKQLGGGALLDCGGYTIMAATHLLGNNIKVNVSNLHFEDGYEVDLFGNATLEDDCGTVAQIAFGMDNSYQCEIELNGSKGRVILDRAFTAPPDTHVCVNVTKGNEKEDILFKDDQFSNSIKHFYSCIIDDRKRLNAYKDLVLQQRLVDEVILKNNTKGGE